MSGNVINSGSDCGPPVDIRVEIIQVFNWSEMPYKSPRSELRGQQNTSVRVQVGDYDGRGGEGAASKGVC